MSTKGYVRDMISVIIAAYNAEQYIEKCLQSLRSQTYSDLVLQITHLSFARDFRTLIKDLLLSAGKTEVRLLQETRDLKIAKENM